MGFPNLKGLPFLSNQDSPEPLVWYQGRILGGALGALPQGITKGAPKRERERREKRKKRKKEGKKGTQRGR